MQDGSFEAPSSIYDIKGWLIFYNNLLDLVVGFSRDKRIKCSISGNEFSQLELALLALEDRYFYQHRGVDFRCVYRLILQVVKRKRLGGVSTIEQQLVRTVLNRKERKLGRKVVEVVVARLLWYHLEKRNILISYASCAYYGYRLNGCDSAALYIFNVSANDLNEEQAMFISSLLVYPLPKVVKENIVQSLVPKNILDDAEKYASSWTTKMRKRMAYGMSSVSQVKKPKK